ncbi:hypothetical protein P691DRAFT_769646 [Macrolepiota fuliginosa MF-IS2]|uniref:Uncharacterized protein n=1 Tax=Macrolepiota fuliginosa MF-IS2 TaxID=1400762 RepID=A0A9P6BVF7_9AGAR|nr:hypothetical protein P691DRAFT_769646 [Macrolepiota fuliginosa MF-IS2]
MAGNTSNEEEAGPGDKDTTNIPRIEAEIALLEEKKGTFRMWGVIVYDYDMVYAEHLGVQLSSNRQAVRLNKGDMECLHGELLFHMKLIEEGNVGKILQNLAASKSGKHLCDIMQSKEMLSVLLHLFNFGSYFHYAGFMLDAWVNWHLICTAGRCIIGNWTWDMLIGDYYVTLLNVLGNGLERNVKSQLSLVQKLQ